jgi:cell division protein FtsB
MRRFLLAVAAVLSCAAVPALAHDDANPPLRYSFNRVGEGFLRLDNATGQVSHCSAHTVGWVCEAVPEDRAALEKEIARLQDEVTSLRKEVASLREPPPPRPPADLTPPSEKSDEAKRLREDLEHARAAFENAWRRLVDMIVNFQKDMMHKG